jgi:hypothetical protein
MTGLLQESLCCAYIRGKGMFEELAEGAADAAIFATQLLEASTGLSIIQKLLEHNDIQTTLRYTHVSKLSLQKVTSPLDKLNLDPGQNQHCCKRPEKLLKHVATN